MSKKKRPPVGSRRARPFRAAPRPGQKESRLKAYRITLSDAAERYLPLDHARRLAQTLIEKLAGADPELMATAHFVYDGRDFTMQKFKDIVYICLAHEELK